jgi:hypothetical protein
MQKDGSPYAAHSFRVLIALFASASVLYMPVILTSIDVPTVGTVTTLEAVGTTENMKGEKMFDPSDMEGAQRDEPSLVRRSNPLASGVYTSVNNGGKPISGSC